MGSERSAVQADVVVVGFGAGGIAAAIDAHDAGARVILLEKMPREQAGGNTRVSGQVWFNPLDVELAKVYLREMACGMPIDDDVVDTWALESSKNTAWVTARAREVEGAVERDPLDPYGQGSLVTKINYGDETLQQLGWETTRDEFPEFNNECDTDYYYVGPTQGFSRLWHTLRASLESRDIEVRYGTRAVALTSDGLAVTGVRADGPDGPVEFAAAGGVVLAAGGFENNPEMARTYLGLHHTTPWGSPANTGDGIRMAQQLGADLRHMHNHMPVVGIEIPGRETGELVYPSGLGHIHVRPDGRRFIDETVALRHGKSTVGGTLELFPHYAMWTIFDEDCRLAGPLCPPTKQYAAGWLKQVDRYAWSDDNSAEIEKGWIARGETLGELAEQLGIDAHGLEDEVARYNRFCEQGEDPAFARSPASLTPITRGPFYGYRWGNTVINTLGGLRKDGEARVLDTTGTPIANLYTAGEMSATYEWALSGGQSIGDALAFGRVAGRNASAHARSRSAEAVASA